MGVEKIQLIGILVISAGVLLGGCIEDAGEDIEKGLEEGVEKAGEALEKVGGEMKELTPQEQAKSGCIELCKSDLARGRDLRNGPCLSNNITEDWVCDVAHSPRHEADANPDNQCLWFTEGKANHFVEVDPECNFIRAK